MALKDWKKTNENRWDRKIVTPAEKEKFLMHLHRFKNGFYSTYKDFPSPSQGMHLDLEFHKKENPIKIIKAFYGINLSSSESYWSVCVRYAGLQSHVLTHDNSRKANGMFKSKSAALHAAYKYMRKH